MTRRIVTVAVAAAVALAAAGPAEAAKWKPCKPVMNLSELDGSRHEGGDVVRIRALRVACGRARRIARRATLRGIEFGPRIPIYSYGDGWLIDRDLRGDVDRYEALKMTDVEATTKIRWRFR